MSFVTKENSVYNEMLKAFADNNAEVSDTLDGQIRSTTSLGFEAGDKIEWPDEVKFLKMSIPGSTRKAQAILCKITSKDGVERYQPFYPTSLNKSIRKLEVDSEGKVIKDHGFVMPEGQPALDIQSKGNMSLDKEFKDMMKNHPNGITVVSYESVPTYRFGSKETTTARRYTYAYV